EGGDDRAGSVDLGQPEILELGATIGRAAAPEHALEIDAVSRAADQPALEADVRRRAHVALHVRDPPIRVAGGRREPAPVLEAGSAGARRAERRPVAPPGAREQP